MVCQLEIEQLDPHRLLAHLVAPGEARHIEYPSRHIIAQELLRHEEFGSELIRLALLPIVGLVPAGRLLDVDLVVIEGDVSREEMSDLVRDREALPRDRLPLIDADTAHIALDEGDTVDRWREGERDHLETQELCESIHIYRRAQDASRFE